MHEVVAAKRHEIEELCRELSVRRLDVFGSAVGDSFDIDSSDVDVLVEFGEGASADYFDRYFSLKEGLERVLGRAVDVVTVSSIKNPYFKQHVMRTREALYAA
ncbi:putative nucleotidyltransferase [Mycobacterium frederiksbergense]|uniref:Nucleotidyltransferase n=1 Tax=Mycolicibacterium frederiksbergense TaxID=117567 RepID=A0ABT6L1S7_9MYCO|nr:nucleotidyltransferase domain-containing protein [Mycolicibacterium frederiksbergense]MDH6196911.1 putative nucleotidyltransferase [Mycolicibacterium frederiksbergense]